MSQLSQFWSILKLLETAQEIFHKMPPIPNLYTLYQIIYDKAVLDYQHLILCSSDITKTNSYLILLINHLNLIIVEKLQLPLPLDQNFLLDFYDQFYNGTS